MNSSILVIEDDSNIQELISEFLSAEGYQVDTANDGLKVYKSLSKEVMI